jgi:hypothetical protein
MGLLRNLLLARHPTWRRRRWRDVDLMMALAGLLDESR